jgi:hypothetical protein
MEAEGFGILMLHLALRSLHSNPICLHSLPPSPQGGSPHVTAQATYVHSSLSTLKAGTLMPISGVRLMNGDKEFNRIFCESP